MAQRSERQSDWRSVRIAGLERCCARDGEVLDVRSMNEDTVQVTIELPRHPRNEPLESRPPAQQADAWETVSEAHGLAHDPIGAMYYRRGDPVDLADQQYKLLQVLVEHRYRVLSHAQLLDAAWSSDWVGDDSVVRVAINRLRKGLGEAGPHLIQSRRGMGYRFVPEPCPDRGRQRGGG